ncbi:unnamed protein product [Cylindrotheca closterium]|uniref:Uncharacterized protein n=1 Tax=Cylindrotheca closterium TaxID=2856 RepID=A0AAD2FN85_9STRA|nr:unnamed protein product [Cylindrotheca closterium]
MPSENASNLTQEEVEEGLQLRVAEAQTWPAKLPFDGLVDYDGESADLFAFVTNDIETRKARFDSKQWPPTKQGLKDLLHHLKLIGLKHGSEFTYDASKGWLTCYRSKPYKGTKLQDLEQFNEKGVLLQYRHKSYHHNRLRNCPDGQTCPRATHTSKDITGDKLCSCRLRLRIHSSKKAGDQSYIYISCKGDTLHKYHAKPAAELPIKAHNLTAEARQIVCAQQKAAVTEYIAAKAANGANSSAADFIQWLQTQAGNPEVNLHYTVLSYEMTPTNGDLVQGTISNPKGRRSKTNPLPNTKTVMRNLTYSNTIRSPVPGDNPVATSHNPSISADPITQREDLHSIVQPTNVANLSVDKLVEGNSMVSRDRNRSLFILAQQHKQRAKVLSHFSQSRPNEKATPTKDKMRKPTPLQIVSPPPMGPGGLAAMRQAVHAAAAPMIKQQLCRFTSTLTVTDQLTRTEFIHNQREAIEAKAIKAVCSKFVRAKAMPGGTSVWYSL